jgi:hypothetical protein
MTGFIEAIKNPLSRMTCRPTYWFGERGIARRIQEPQKKHQNGFDSSNDI